MWPHEHLEKLPALDFVDVPRDAGGQDAHKSPTFDAITRGVLRLRWRCCYGTPSCGCDCRRDTPAPPLADTTSHPAPHRAP